MRRTLPSAQTIAYLDSSHIHRDGHLVSAAQAGSVSAFEELCKIYSKPLFGIAFYITKNREDAQDAVQDSFLRAFTALKSFENRSSYYTWITRIAINSSLMILRKRKLKRETSLLTSMEPEEESEPVEFKDLRPDPEQRFEQCQRHLKLLRAISKLARPLRDVVEVRMKQDCSISEVARHLDISAAAAKSRMFRARLRLSSAPGLKELTMSGD